MKIVVMGSGGVGGFYGGRLAHAGYDVTFVARGSHLHALRENGLLIENEAQGDIHVPRVRVTDDPASAGRADLVLVGVKLWDTEAAARAIKPIIGPDTGVLSVQNGVIKDDILRRELGASNLMGGVAYVGTTIARPGVIRQTGTLQRLVFGEYDGHRSARAEGFLEALLKAGIQAELSTDIRKTIWEKYVFLVGLSGATSTIRLPIGPIRSNPRTRAFLLDLMKETVAVGRAHGVNLPPDYAEQRLAFADTVAAHMTSSLYHDLERGNRLEVEWLSGGVVQLGEVVGVPTPMNRAVWDILALHAQGEGMRAEGGGR
jgi:2-dehydropantoate 2-reductase